MLEAGFLILLAVVAGLAELRPALIVLVMAVGWLLVALIEYFAWRQSPDFATIQRYVVAEACSGSAAPRRWSRTPRHRHATACPPEPDTAPPASQRHAGRCTSAGHTRAGHTRARCTSAG